MADFELTPEERAIMEALESIVGDPIVRRAVWKVSELIFSIDSEPWKPDHARIVGGFLRLLANKVIEAAERTSQGCQTDAREGHATP